jgi:hypothetical protein
LAGRVDEHPIDPWESRRVASRAMSLMDVKRHGIDEEAGGVTTRAHRIRTPIREL